MKIEFHKNFIKNFNKRISPNKPLKQRFLERAKLFSQNPNNPILKNHHLAGKKYHLRSFSITGDIRVVYLIKDGTAYFLDIGTHGQVY